MPPERPVQHQNDSIAKSVLAGAVAKWASLNGCPEDYGIDYNAELFVDQPDGSGSIGTGIDFQIQLKGKSGIRPKAGRVAFSFDVSKLVHLIDNKRTPVFIVVVNTTLRVGYFVFVQDLEFLLPMKWRKQKTVTIPISEKDSVSNQERFVNAVRAADRRMAELRPGALAAAAGLAIKRLEARDSRVKVESVCVRGGVSEYAIKSTEDIKFTMFFEGEPARVQKAVQTMLGDGLPLVPSELGITIRVAGLPVIGDASQSISRVEACMEKECVVKLVRIRNGQQVGHLDFHGLMRGGTRSVRFKSSVIQGAFEISLEAGIAGETAGSMTMQMAWDGEIWEKRCVTDQLPGYGLMRGLLADVSEQDSIGVEVWLEGNSQMRIELPISDAGQLLMTGKILDVIDRLKRVASGLGIQMMLPMEYDEELIRSLEIGESLLDGRKIPVGFRGTLEEPVAGEVLDLAESLVEGYCVRLDYPFEIAGKKYLIRPTLVEIKEAKLHDISKSDEPCATRYEIQSTKSAMLSLITKSAEYPEPGRLFLRKVASQSDHAE